MMIDVAWNPTLPWKAPLVRSKRSEPVKTQKTKMFPSASTSSICGLDAGFGVLHNVVKFIRFRQYADGSIGCLSILCFRSVMAESVVLAGPRVSVGSAEGSLFGRGANGGSSMRKTIENRIAAAVFVKAITMVVWLVFFPSPSLADPLDLIFEDGFESGTPCFWSWPTCEDSVFPEVTVVAQEPAHDDDDADAAAVYPSGAPVVINSGESRIDRVDLRVPGRGQIHFELARRYRSGLAYDGPLGFGWDFTYNERLKVFGNGDVARSNGMGHIDVWTSIGGGRFSSPAGFFGTLTEGAGGSFILRETDGFKRTFDSAGRLVLHEDRFGNTMVFENDQTDHLTKVTDAFGREFEFDYRFVAGRLRLAIVRDFEGREVHFEYDGEGDLLSARGPVVTGTSTANNFPSGRTETYTYSSGTGDPGLDHNLLTVTYPEEVETGGPAAMTFGYGSSGVEYDRVLSLALGGTNASMVPAGGTVVYGYTEVNQSQPPGDPGLPRLVVSVTQRNGNQVGYFLNEFEHLIIVREMTRGLRPGEPPDHYETNYFYDADGQQVSVFLPEGNTVQYSYDASPRAAQRNLVEIRRIADVDRGGGEDLVTTFTYEPVFNQLATTTDPRGNAVGFVPPIGTASAERYTTWRLFDYQENTDPIPDALTYGIDLSGVDRGLGDLNGDGLTDQVAGNLVRIIEPTVLLRPDSHEAARLGSTSQVILTEVQWNDRGQTTAVVDPEGNLTTQVYFPENDPDGDGTPVPGQASTYQGGYLQQLTSDATPPPPRRTSVYPPVVLETALGYDPVGNINSVRNPRGVVTAFEINQLNEIVVTTRGADVSQAVATGQLITGEAAFGYRERLFYDFNGRVVLHEEEDRAGVSTTAGVGDWVERTWVYDILGNRVKSMVEIDGSTNLTTAYRFDGNQNLVRLVQPEGNVVRAVFDERDLLFKQRFGFGAPEEAVFQYDYDLNENLVRFIDAEDTDGSGGPEITLFTYDGFDRETVITDALAGEEVWSYDVASNATRAQFFGHPANQPGSANVLLTDAQYHHDELDRAYQVDDVLFLAAGFSPLRPVDLRDHNSDGLVTSFEEFDALSRLTFAVEDDTDFSSTAYDGAGRPVELADALGNRKVFTYDKNENVIQLLNHEISPDGVVPTEWIITVFAYDQLDRMVRSTDNAGRTGRFGYDSRDNFTTSSDAVGPPLDPDPWGQFPGPINAPGNTATRYYDGRDLLLMEITDLRVGGVGGAALDTSNPFNPDGQITMGYAYDGNARLTAVIDDNGNSTTYAYDALDRRVLQTNADSTGHAFGYDRDGNLVTVLDPTTSLVTNSYDALNRLSQRSIVRAPGVLGTTAESYGYDGVSRMTFASDNNGSAPETHGIERHFDSLSRQLEELENGEPHSSVWSGDGNRVRLQYPSGRILEYDYDAVNRVKQVVAPFETTQRSTVVADFSWIGPGPCSCHCPCESRPLVVALGNGTEMSLLDPTGTSAAGYNDAQEIVGLSHLMGVFAFIDRAYAYNRASMRTGESLLDVMGVPINAFSFDSSYRVVDSFIAADGSFEGYSTEFEYTLDGVGNRRSVDITQTFNAGGSYQYTDNYSSNVVNEYDSAGGGGPRTHDANGNLTQAAGFDYSWDYRNRLVEVRRSSDQVVLARYEYDSFNRRVEKKVFDLGSPGTLVEERHYLYDEWNAIEERADDLDYASFGPVATYVYGPGIDQPIQTQTSVSAPGGAGLFYYHRDALNNVVAMTDIGGTVVEKTLYSDFGGFSQDVSIEQPYLFQGRRYDPETGLFYYRNRYYDPLVGRFIQRDPVWDPFSVGNQYTFVGNNPVTAADPLGLWTIQIGAGIGGGLGAGGTASGGIVIQIGGGEIIDVGLAGSAGGGGIAGGEIGASGQVTFSNSAGSTIEDLNGDSTAVGGTVAAGPGVSFEESISDSEDGVNTTTIGLTGGGGAEGHIYKTKTKTTPTVGDFFKWVGKKIWEPDPPKIPADQAAAHARRRQFDEVIRKRKATAAANRSELEFSKGGYSMVELSSQEYHTTTKKKADARANARARAAKVPAREKKRVKQKSKRRRPCVIETAPRRTSARARGGYTHSIGVRKRSTQNRSGWWNGRR